MWFAHRVAELAKAAHCASGMPACRGGPTLRSEAALMYTSGRTRAFRTLSGLIRATRAPVESDHRCRQHQGDQIRRWGTSRLVSAGIYTEFHLLCSEKAFGC